MIARMWKGWTKVDDAEEYEKLLREVVYSQGSRFNPISFKHFSGWVSLFLFPKGKQLINGLLKEG